MRTQLRRIVQLSIGIATLLLFLGHCAWFSGEKPDPIIIKPEPVGGYESISTRIYYPESVREQNIEGTVTVNAHISITGVVTETKIAKKLNSELDRIAANAIKRTTFKPALRDGQPEEVWIAIPIVFTLKEWQSRQSPFKDFTMIVRPDASYNNFDVEIKGFLKTAGDKPLHFECLLPINSEKTWVKTVSGELVETSSVRDESGEWLVFDIFEADLAMGFSYQSFAAQVEQKFRYKFVLNHPVPDWTLAVIYGDQDVHFTQDPSRISQESDGASRFEYDLEKLDAFEPRYLEIELVE